MKNNFIAVSFYILSLIYTLEVAEISVQTFSAGTFLPLLRNCRLLGGPNQCSFTGFPFCLEVF